METEYLLFFFLTYSSPKLFLSDDMTESRFENIGIKLEYKILWVYNSVGLVGVGISMAEQWLDKNNL